MNDLPLLATSPVSWPRWAVMWALAFAVYAGCKWLTWRGRDVDRVPTWKQIAYLVAWPGLDADAFLKRFAERPGVREWLFAAAKLGFGISLLWGVLPASGELSAGLRGWIGMIGIVFVLHFGSFHLLSCWWRSCGLAARPLMDWPVAATSVSEFWSRRWNVAFRDVTHRFLFRPLSARLGPRCALFAGFLFSGILHDLVITVPAGGGYGGPTAFFLIQAIALFVERSRLGRAIGLGQGMRGWLFTAGAVVGPAPLLFPFPFVDRVVVPFLQALGAW